MKPTLYTKNVLKTLSTDKKVKNQDGTVDVIKGPKFGMRALLRKTPLVNLAHAIDGFKEETGEALMAVQPYLLGFQMSEESRTHLIEELGDCKYYLTVAAKMLKVRLPSSGRKGKLEKMTYTEALLNLDALATKMLAAKKKMYYGQELNQELLSGLVLEAHKLLDALTGSMLNLTPGELMEMNIAKLAERYPDGFFTNVAEAGRDGEKEIAAMKAAGKGTAKAKADATA